MTYDQICEAWNNQADGYNQWDSLSEREKVEWAYSLAKPLGIFLVACPVCGGTGQVLNISCLKLCTNCAGRGLVDR